MANVTAIAEAKKISNKKELIEFADEFATYHRAAELLTKKVKVMQAQLAPLVRKFVSIQNQKSQAVNPSEVRILETEIIRLAVTTPFTQNPDTVISEEFKTGDSEFINDQEKAKAVLRKHAPELLSTVPLYNARDYWESLPTEARKEQFSQGKSTVKGKVKGKLPKGAFSVLAEVWAGQPK